MRDISKMYGVLALVFNIIFIISASLRLFILAGISVIFLIIYVGIFFGSLRPPFLEEENAN